MQVNSECTFVRHRARFHSLRDIGDIYKCRTQESALKLTKELTSLKVIARGASLRESSISSAQRYPETHAYSLRGVAPATLASDSPQTMMPTF